MHKALSEQEIQVLGVLAQEPTEFVSSTTVAVALEKRVLADGIANALARLEVYGLVEEHPAACWKFRILAGGLEELAAVAS